MASVTDTSFPVGVLDGCETALVLFAAGFGGVQDARHIAEAGLRATCVDIRIKLLLEMRASYPEDWNFIVADAFDFADETNRIWDIVTADPFTGQFEQAARALPAWCELARKTVVLGTGTETEPVVPDGWEVTDRIRRSDYKGGVYWTVVERC